MSSKGRGVVFPKRGVDQIMRKRIKESGVLKSERGYTNRRCGKEGDGCRSVFGLLE